MKQTLVKFTRQFIGATAVTLLLASSTQAFEAAGVTIKRIVSPNAGGHLYLELSGNADCPGAVMPYAIIQGWGDQAEPGLTNRNVMLQLALTAFASGKKIRVYGASCYLNNYLFADSISLLE